MGRIQLEGMEFYAYHGVYPEERQNGAWFKVELSIETELKKAGESDLLEDTLDYTEVYAAIAEEMNIISNLMENLAARIMKRLKTSFPAIKETELKITKLSPPMNGKLSGVSVIMRD